MTTICVLLPYVRLGAGGWGSVLPKEGKRKKSQDPKTGSRKALSKVTVGPDEGGLEG